MPIRLKLRSVLAVGLALAFAPGAMAFLCCGQTVPEAAEVEASKWVFEGTVVADFGCRIGSSRGWEVGLRGLRTLSGGCETLLRVDRIDKGQPPKFYRAMGLNLLSRTSEVAALGTQWKLYVGRDDRIDTCDGNSRPLLSEEAPAGAALSVGELVPLLLDRSLAGWDPK